MTEERRDVHSGGRRRTPAGPGSAAGAGRRRAHRGHRARRRRGEAREPPEMKSGDLVLDMRRRRAERSGTVIELSPKEFSLLEFLMRNEGRVVTRTQILDHLWGYDYATDSNLVDVYVAYLRREGDGGHKRQLIRTVRGIGYALGD